MYHCRMGIKATIEGLMTEEVLEKSQVFLQGRRSRGNHPLHLLETFPAPVYVLQTQPSPTRGNDAVYRLPRSNGVRGR